MEDPAISSTALQNPKHRERLLTMLLSELDGMVYLCRVDRHWTMEFISQGCRALTGYSRDDLLLNRSLSFNDALSAGCGSGAAA